MSTNTNQLASLLFLAQRVVQKHARSHNCKISKLSVLQLETLRFIKENESVTMRALATHLGITPPSATSIIDELSKQGLIERQADATDRRKICLVISLKGEKQLVTCLEEFVKGFDYSMRRLSNSEKEQLIKLLLKITE